MAYLFISDNDMSTSQFNSDINYYIAPGLLEEVVTVFITKQPQYKKKKSFLFLVLNIPPQIQFADKPQTPIVIFLFE